jgi:hypothetical protein
LLRHSQAADGTLDTSLASTAFRQAGYCRFWLPFGKP